MASEVVSDSWSLSALPETNHITSPINRSIDQEQTNERRNTPAAAVLFLGRVLSLFAKKASQVSAAAAAADLTSPEGGRVPVPHCLVVVYGNETATCLLAASTRRLAKKQRVLGLSCW